MKLAEVGQADVKRLTVPTILLVVVGLTGFLAPGTWRFVAIAAAVQGLIALSSGMLFGRVGLLALCPLGFAGISTWIMAWFTVNQRLPFLIMVAVSALAAVPAGLIVGGLALRLRGVNLAIVTLAFGAAIVSIFAQHKFPGSQDSVRRSTRPMGFTSDRMYFVMCFAILIVETATSATSPNPSSRFRWACRRCSCSAAPSATTRPLECRCSTATWWCGAARRGWRFMAWHRLRMASTRCSARSG